MVEKDVNTVYNNFSAGQKAALLLIALGQKWATEILRHLKEDDVRNIAYWISQLKHVPKELTERVIKDFHSRLSNNTSLATNGGRDYLYDVLVGIMGEHKAKDLVEELSTKDDHEVFRILKKIDPKQLAAYFKNERPQTVALMMAYLDGERAALIIEALPADFQALVIMCLAKMEETDSEVVEAMEGALAQNIGRMASDKTLKKVGGAKAVAQILNNMRGGTDKTILEKITEEDFDLAIQIKDLMFVFNDVVLLDDKSLQTVLKDIDQTNLILSLKGASDEVLNKIFSNISKRQAESINDELAFMGPVKASAVIEAQQRIVSLIRKLDEEGKVLIQGKGGSDEVIS